MYFYENILFRINLIIFITYYKLSNNKQYNIKYDFELYENLIILIFNLILKIKEFNF